MPLPVHSNLLEVFIVEENKNLSTNPSRRDLHHDLRQGSDLQVKLWEEFPLRNILMEFSSSSGPSQQPLRN